jgi:Holliday junction resolvase
MREQQIQGRIIKYLESVGAYCVKVVQATKAGVPDILCCHQGRFYGFEVKTATGRVSKLQEYNIERIREAGGGGGVVRSVEDVKEILG